MNNNTVITINRQLGSGGSYVGKQLAEKLSYKYIDHEIIRRAAEELKLNERHLSTIDERLSSFWQAVLVTQPMLSCEYIPPVFSLPTNAQLFDIESEIITKSVEKEPCVIIGRCASYILKDNPNRFNVFLHADQDFRQSRIEKLYGLSPSEAKKKINKCDIERKKYFYTFTGQDWTDLTQYDLVINTSKVDLDKVVTDIISYL